ncbi:thiamine pyrophosphate-binding protein [Pseudoalteromonas sp. SR44-5]|jgi:acetolactate synthase-1/2/3 large subunit|uniref:Thiamine pyrophosphate-binding protein n=2 Tax=Pseudoalteromonas TaxID=53246 RepID=A0ABY3FCW0_9GAMM|nr:MULTISPECIES: thiamine pyrophosphate-binding protein [Pseudoalteromonas]MBB1293563.1 thiamine pyrophosphate-binding protein [Pseudoalteromonas sp. SR41-4]MBB1300479.1 thiamine pyrophosphate-binding protein [Pseudoalteromonas sp. SR44-8]MBB1309589.1 thiamine pyrophosphate-binding protein [Pseudoalteromonas sp. SR41-8]MBB1332997.1 thiamine pyrophosphate-binding protein [Pseudoalteromonas sp. SR41-6]MBB1341140.1 thiamine pyrophosphate-binding protein [Pseudoalteromonas sp. SR45-6]
MKLTDYIASYLAQLDIKHVFVLQGGAALHLIDSIEKHPSLSAIAMQHEQSCAMAADSYAKTHHVLGVTIATSGPGATNLLTGIASSYFDSVATLHITGNVASFRQSHKLGVRQYGFQETDIVSMAKPITKYAIQLKRPNDIITVLPEAIKAALSGRPGPVLIDIPDDFQREILDIKKIPFEAFNQSTVNHKVIQENIFNNFIVSLKQAKKPLFILGAGCHNSAERLISLATKLKIPFLSTWPLKGIANHDDELNLGNFGTHSLRGNNIVLQNCDFIISIGCRLDSKATAKLDTFAREAKIAMVDIDHNEIEKFAQLGKVINYQFPVSVQVFLDAFSLHCEDLIEIFKNNDVWLNYITDVTQEFNYIPEYNYGGVNPYLAVELFSGAFCDDQNICVDTGTCLPLTLVYGKEKKGQQYISSYNNTPMGYALPASIGVALAKEKEVFCIVGDGGLQMNIQELSTLNHLKLPVIIIVFNNSGHCMIKQTQDDWLDSNYFSADCNNGLPHINFSEVAKAYGIDSEKVENNEQLKLLVERLHLRMDQEGPKLIELVINPNFRYEPIIKYGNPLENMSPELAYIKQKKAMLIPSLKENL